MVNSRSLPLAIRLPALEVAADRWSTTSYPHRDPRHPYHLLPLNSLLAFPQFPQFGTTTKVPMTSFDRDRLTVAPVRRRFLVLFVH